MVDVTTDEDKENLLIDKFNKLTKEEVDVLIAELINSQYKLIQDNLSFVDESIKQYKNEKKIRDLYFEALEYIVKKTEDSKIIITSAVTKINQKEGENE